jgi:hypothetical protein
VCGYGQSEVGAGIVSEDGVFEHLRKRVVGEVFHWFAPHYCVRSPLASELAFDEASLNLLLSVVKLVRPLYLWDMRSGTFGIGPSVIASWGDLEALREFSLAAADPLSGGHLSRVVRSTLQ